MDEVTFNTLMIKTLCSGEVLGLAATGFVYKRNECYYLVTNFHVLSGMRADNQKTINRWGHVPEEIEIILGNVSDNQNPRRSKFLLAEPGSESERWYVHPDLIEKHIDVAVMPLPLSGSQRLAAPMNEVAKTCDMYVGPGAEVFVVGFPLGINVRSFPIWKRASMATEIELPVDGQPKFLIDTSTREGMSGAPVIARAHSGYRDRFGKTQMGGDIATQLVGVYSGRLEAEDKSDKLGAQLAVAWNIHVVDEIIDNEVVYSSLARRRSA
mgnify:CR=1 FL=1|jgi:hypothetical protein